jgi:hypothetical protein
MADMLSLDLEKQRPCRSPVAGIYLSLNSCAWKNEKNNADSVQKNMGFRNLQLPLCKRLH